MASCSPKVDCSGVFDSVPISATQDILGIGILTSFFLTAGLAFFTFIFAFFNDMLPGQPDEYLTWADRAILHQWGLCKRCRQRGRNNLNNTPISAPPCPHEDPEADERRRKGVQSFILALSDQQLLTGLATMIAALMQHCSLSCYEFGVVSSLAMLASTTHVATLFFLRQYLMENKEVRHVRVVGIIGNFILMIYTFLMTAASWEVDVSAPIHCVLSSSWALSKEMSEDFITVIPILVLLFTQYVRVVFSLYANGWEIRDCVLYQTLRVFCSRESSKYRLSHEEYDEWFSKQIRESKSRPGSIAAREKLLKAATEKPSTFRVFIFVAAEYTESFISFIPLYILDLAYGVTNVINARKNGPRLTNSINTVDFGQIIPLLLLSLPALAAMEIHYDRPKKPWASQVSAEVHHPQSSSSDVTLNPRAPVSRHTEEQFDMASHNNSRDRRAINSYPFIAPTLGSISPELHRKAHHGLNIVFWGMVGFNIALGVLFWYFYIVSIIWLFFWTMSVAVDMLMIATYFNSAYGKLKALRKSGIKPLPGSRVPPPSIASQSLTSISLQEMPSTVASLQEPDCIESHPASMSEAQTTSSPPTGDPRSSEELGKNISEVRRRTTYESFHDSQIDAVTRVSSLSVMEATIGMSAD